MAVDLSEKILQYLVTSDSISSLELASHFEEDHQKVVGAIKSLQSLGDVLDVEQQSTLAWKLTPEGMQVAEKGSHEAVVYRAIPPEGAPQAELMKNIPNAKVGFNKAMSSGWISIDKSKGAPRVIRKVDAISDKVQQDLQLIQKNEGDKLAENVRQEYKKRNLLLETTIKSFAVRPGKEFSTSVTRLETDLTGDMISSGSWKEKQFKPYNFNALGAPLSCGHLHPLLKVRAEFRQIFLEMGFTEMPANNYIDSCFWNFDALFQPQQHPARDAHDTFFVTEPKTAAIGPESYVSRVAQVHSKGGFGSQGYGYDWQLEEAKKNVLRTHTTGLSAQMLYQLAQQAEFHPAKYFSIDRVFRNETLDATHLAEFCQIEGVIADRGLALSDLVGTLYEFFQKLGITQLRFKPAYNPYTEPSMEIFSFHPGLKKWVEVGNSGLFRPEMLLPMGLPEDVSVLGWGLSLERPTMIKYGIDNIRDLVGPRVNLQMVHDNPICRLEKHGRKQNPLEALEKRWNAILSRAQQLVKEVALLQQLHSPPLVTNIPSDVTVFADPYHPPHVLQVLVRHMAEACCVAATTHVHSSVKELPEKLEHFLEFHGSSGQQGGCGTKGLLVRLIWKKVGMEPMVVISPTRLALKGESVLVRFLARITESRCTISTWPALLQYESRGPEWAARVDHWMDIAEGARIKSGYWKGAVKMAERVLLTQPWLLGSQPSLADAMLWSTFKQRRVLDSLPKSMQEWANGCQEWAVV